MVITAASLLWRIQREMSGEGSLYFHKPNLVAPALPGVMVMDS